MRACPNCRTEYDDAVTLCPRDGTPLSSPSPSPSSSSSSSSSPSSSPSPSLAQTAPAPAPASDPVAGEIFDSLVGATLASRYRIVRRIGEGGMGAVYEARHTVIGKRVAVKVLLEKFLAKSDFVARLLQEARLASAIGHEHIVDVTDFGTTDDGRAFVVMEFLEGEALAQLVMREAPLPVERSLRIAQQVAGALDAAHAKGIVHRDVKPENVYLVRRGDADFVKVVDFGISKAVKQGQGDEAPEYRLTHTGLLLGTPLYMSPEQARGEEDLDHRVDIWALGVMLYECLTGEVPFRANNYLGIISQVLTHEARPPSKLRPELGIPEAVEAVVMRAVEKDRTRRYQLMADLSRDIERLLAGDQNVGSGAAAPSLSATPPPVTARGHGRVWAWAAAGAAVVGGVALVLTRPEKPVAAPGAAPAAVVAPAAASQAAAARGAEGRAGERPTGPASATPSSSATPSPSPSPTPSPLPSAGSGPARSPAAGAATPPRTAAARAQRARLRAGPTADRDPAATRGAERPGARTPEAAALRGAVPARSGEGYPDP